MKAGPALDYLRGHPDTWIPITNDETIDALRDLRKDGHRIVTRFNDDGTREAKYVPPVEIDVDLLNEARRIFDGDIERVVTADGEVVSETVPTVPPVSPGMAGRPFPIRRIENPDGSWRIETTEQARCECGDLYLVKEDHDRGQHHQNWLSGMSQVEVPHPEQPPIGKFLEGEVPEHFEIGEVVVCPVCKNRRKKDALYTTAPHKPGHPCSNCNGNGLVPNVGPIAHGGSPSGPEPEPTEPTTEQLPVGPVEAHPGGEGGDSSERLPAEPSPDSGEPEHGVAGTDDPPVEGAE